MKRIIVVRCFLFILAIFAIPQIPISHADVLRTPAMETSMAANALLVDVAVAGDRLVAIGERGHIIYSDDSGQSWSQAKVPVSALLTAVHFADEQHGWAVGHGAIVLHSSDSGMSWVKQMDGNVANKMVIEQAEQRYAAAEQELASASEELVEDLEYALEDAQFALEDAVADAEIGPSKPLLDVWFKDKNTGYVVGAYGFFFKTSDGGETWQNWGGRIDNTDRFHLNAIRQIAGDLLFIVGESGYIFRSTDVGETWETIDGPYDGSLFGLTGNGRDNELFVFGLRGNIFFSKDAGLSWSDVDAGAQESLMNASFDDNGKMIIVGNSGVMLLSNDYGASFKLQTREDRLAVLSADFLTTDKILLVGESGVTILEDLAF